MLDVPIIGCCSLFSVLVSLASRIVDVDSVTRQLKFSLMARHHGDISYLLNYATSGGECQKGAVCSVGITLRQTLIQDVFRSQSARFEIDLAENSFVL